MENGQENIILGDFNCTMSNIDRSNHQANNIEYGRQELLKLIEKNGLVDVYRKRYPKKQVFTYFKPNSNVKSRIDMSFLSESLYPWVTDVGTVPATFSDHHAIHVKLNVCKEERGDGRWIMNKRSYFQRYSRKRSYLFGGSGPKRRSSFRAN